jgi:broad specificity phosphatase PhoE
LHFFFADPQIKKISAQNATVPHPARGDRRQCSPGLVTFLPPSLQSNPPSLTITSAGSRDSELTNHGVQQATRLGHFFSSTDVKFTHIFSSHLRRAVKTAELIRDGQSGLYSPAEARVDPPAVTQLPALMEQDFGSLEGVSYISRPYNFKSGRSESHAQDSNFVEMETREAMRERVDSFLASHLMPLVHSSPSHNPHTVAVVSHGITLSVLWSRILKILPEKSVSLIPELVDDSRPVDLERLGGWTNTGFLEMELRRASAPDPVSGPNGDGEWPTNKEDTIITHVETVAPDLPKDQEVVIDVRSSRLHGWTTVVKVINGRDHLNGLKRTRGGVGSAAHDENQKSLDSFFQKKRKT